MRSLHARPGSASRRSKTLSPELAALLGRRSDMGKEKSNKERDSAKTAGESPAANAQVQFHDSKLVHCCASASG